ncbi:hypothetical protein [Huintestinicola sp.]|uniref:hypothetical protein n=1 Tax=Huintestinicola sp. TaxID=2981661 RepID=UPI003D7DF2E6
MERNKSVVAVIDNLTPSEAARLTGAIQEQKALIAPQGRGHGITCNTTDKGRFLGGGSRKRIEKSRSR